MGSSDILQFRRILFDGVMEYLVDSARTYQSAYLTNNEDDDMFIDVPEIRYTAEDIPTMLELMFMCGKRIAGHELEEFLNGIHTQKLLRSQRVPQ